MSPSVSGSVTKDLMRRTMAVHVRYKSIYISLPSSAKQRKRKMSVSLCEFYKQILNYIIH